MLDSFIENMNKCDLTEKEKRDLQQSREAYRTLVTMMTMKSIQTLKVMTQKSG